MRISHDNFFIVGQRIRHRAMLTPVSSLLTRLIHISRSCWSIYHLFEIITVRWTGLDNVLYKSIASKNIQSDMNYVLKTSKLYRAARALMDE